MDYNLFEAADAELVNWVQSVGSSRKIADQTRLIEEGSESQGLFIVESGSLKIKTSRAGSEDTVGLGEIGRGSVVGEMSWLEDRPSVASVDACAGTVILHVPNTALAALKTDDHPVAPLLYRTIATKLSLQIQTQNTWIHRFTTSRHEPLRKVLVLFADLTEQDLDWLRRLGQLQRLPAGGVLLREGDHVTALYLILTGDAKIRICHQGRLEEVGSSRRGELLGEMSLLNPTSSGASAQVDSPGGMELLRFNTTDLLLALEQNPSHAARFWRGLARMMSQRSRDQLLERGLADASRRAQADRMSDEDELDLIQLSAITTAGSRFDWLCRQFRDQED